MPKHKVKTLLLYLLFASIAWQPLRCQIILSYFSWDSTVAHPGPNNPHIADVGPNGVSSGTNVRQRTPAQSNWGISPGFINTGIICGNNANWGGQPPGSNGVQSASTSCRRSIDMLIDNSGGFATWFDYPELIFDIYYRRRSESDSAVFFHRGANFLFGMWGGNLGIRYLVEDGLGGFNAIPNPCCGYHTAIFGQTPDDNTWRHYEFSYSQATGIAEIKVNGTSVWTTPITDQYPGRAMYWTGASQLRIGAGMDGLGWMQAALDEATISRTGPLPVVLTDFLATQSNRFVSLDWQTLSETNSNYFTVERSPDGMTWTKLGDVMATRNSLEPNSYSLIDFSPLEGMNIYRLRQTDLNGQVYFLDYAQTEILYNYSGLISIFPNPVVENNQIEIHFACEKNGLIRTDILGMDGKLFETKMFDAREGKNQLFLSTESWPNGVHFIKINSEGRNYFEKIIVNR